MSDPVQQKLIELETTLGLLQHDFEAQNEMLLRDQRRISLLELAVARLTDQFDHLRATGNSLPPNDPPPHY